MSGFPSCLAPGVVLDTNVVSELSRPHPNPNVVAFLHSTPNTLLTAITVAELRYGVAKMDGGRRRLELTETVERAIAAYAGRILALDEHATGAFAQVVSVRMAAGRPISYPDAQIAAICMSRGLTLATRNLKDFEGLPLALADPWT